MKNFIELIANKPWILIIFGFFLLISVWVFFFTMAARNQPEVLPLSSAPVTKEVRITDMGNTIPNLKSKI